MSTKRKVIRDSIQGITQPAIVRMLRRAGVFRIGKSVHAEMRGILLEWIKKIVGDIVVFTEHARRKTISRQDLEDALVKNGVYLAADINENAKHTASLQSCNARGKSGKTSSGGAETDGTKKPHRYRPGTVALRDIRRHQKNSDCLAIPSLNFQRLVREVTQDFADGLRFKEKQGIFALLQLAAEDYLIKLCVDANKCALHADRQTLFHTDLQLARDIRRED